VARPLSVERAGLRGCSFGSQPLWFCDVAKGVRNLPLYAYRCTQCGNRFEKIQSFSAEPEKVCPKCGGPAERLLTAPGLQFKGAGWYVNDYASKGSASSSESTSAETKTEAKPVAKPGGEGGATSGSTTPAPASGSTTS
jgi:putative FmdB family regulatory protein